MTALIIDDEVDLCLLIKSYLQRKGYNVVIAHSLTDGLSKAAEAQPQIIFLDNNLPDGLGWVAAPDIAKNYPSTYQYLISAYHPQPPEMPADAKFTILEKPISFADMEFRIPTIVSAAGEENIGNAVIN